MEHRFYYRQPLDLDVKIKRRNKPELQGKCRDISLGGMFVRLRENPLSKMEPLEIELTLGTEEGIKHCCLEGWVVYSGPSGAGMAFNADDEDNCRPLWQFLRGHGQLSG